MHQFRPLRIIGPKRGGAFRTEMALGAALLAMPFTVVDHGMVDADCFPAPDLHRLLIAHDIDGETAAARGLAADRAIAKLIGIGRVAHHAEMNRATAARAFELPGHDLTFFRQRMTHPKAAI